MKKVLLAVVLSAAPGRRSSARAGKRECADEGTDADERRYAHGLLQSYSKLDAKPGRSRTSGWQGIAMSLGRE